MQAQESWLTLSEYSNKYRVSISTLRRRIKASDIHYQFEDGKYFIFDEALNAQKSNHRPSQEDGIKASKKEEKQSTEKEYVGFKSGTTVVEPNVGSEPVFTAANRLLTELKRAYMLVLQEKEEQILILKEEISDLKTLVRVLENENQRLKALKFS